MVANGEKRPRTDSDGADQSHSAEVAQAIQKLRKLQDELQMVIIEAHDKILATQTNYNELTESIYIRRNEIISSIPDFWLTVFMHHPALEGLLKDEDQKIFTYLGSLNVEDFKGSRKGFCITFNFKANPYFENTELTKTITFTDEGILMSKGTTILWKEGKGPSDENNEERNGNKRPLCLDSFFSWFSYCNADKVEVEDDLVAQIIKEDVWPNPVIVCDCDGDEGYSKDIEESSEESMEDSEDEDDSDDDDSDEDDSDDNHWSGRDGA